MKKYLALCVSLVMAHGMLIAQEDDLQELEEYTLEETVADPVGIIPERPTETLFGTSRSVLELPRSVSMIEGDMLDRYAVQSVSDFISVAAGTFTDNFFGIPGSLDIRGSTSDTFFRGFRRVENRGNYPTPITATQRVEVVRGPPTPYYGGGKVGGFMNFIPKSARTETAKFIERPTGQISLTYGTYDKKQLEVESGIPLNIGDGGGLYVYGQFEDSGSFYNRVVNRWKIIQVSTDIDLNERWNVEFGGMYVDAKLIQNPGWNRVTQDLIDNGTYITGSPAVEIPDANGNGFLDEAEAVSFGLDVFNFGLGTPDTVNPNTALNVTGTTKLSRKQVFTDPADFGDSETSTLYFDINGRFGEAFTVKNQFFYDEMTHTKFTSYGFTASYVPEIFEYKLSVNQTVRKENFKGDFVYGFSFRTVETTNREAFSQSMQIFDRRDLTVGPTAQDRFASAFTDGRNWNTQDASEYDDLGVFGMADLTIAKNIGIVAGLRYDDYEVEATDLNTGITSDDSDGVVTYNLSGTYRINLWEGTSLVSYITYAESTFLEVDQGGGVPQANIASGDWLQDSDLWEGGVKGSFFGGKLFTTFDVYQQNRTFFDNISGAVINTRSTGYELEMRYAPDKHWAFTLTGTWQKTVERPASGFGSFTVIPANVLGLSPEEAFGGRFFTGSGFAGLPSFEADGQPDKVISIYGSYTSDKSDKGGQWGITFGSTYVAEVFAGRLGQFGGAKLPDYWLTNLTAFTELGRWRLSGTVKNVFDERYFVSQAIFHDSLVLPGAGTTADVTLTFSW